MYFISSHGVWLHRENGSDDIQLNKEIFGISAHLTVNAQSWVEMKNLILQKWRVFVVATVLHKVLWTLATCGQQCARIDIQVLCRIPRTSKSVKRFLIFSLHMTMPKCSGTILSITVDKWLMWGSRRWNGGIIWMIEVPRKTKLYSVLYHITVRTQAKIELTICSMFLSQKHWKIHRHICWFTKLLVERVHHRQLWKNKQK